MEGYPQTAGCPRTVAPHPPVERRRRRQHPRRRVLAGEGHQASEQRAKCGRHEAAHVAVHVVVHVTVLVMDVDSGTTAHDG